MSSTARTPMQQRRHDEQLAMGIIFGMMGAVALSAVGLVAFSEVIQKASPPPKDVVALPAFVANLAADVDAAQRDARDAAQRGEASAASAENAAAKARAAVAGGARVSLPDGAIFEGANVGGQGEGAGIVSGRARVELGYFLAGRLNGDGASCARLDCGGASYFGGFRDGAASGVGRLRLPDGSVYRGEVRDGAPFGFGVWTNGRDKYEGGFNNGQRAGHGVLTPADAAPQAGFWADGQLVEPLVRQTSP
jgi:hypothetical protein